MYSVEEARKALGVGRNTMYEALKRGDIPSIRIGRRILIPVDALEKLLKSELQAPIKLCPRSKTNV